MDQAAELRARGIAAAKAGDKLTARRLLQQAVRLEPMQESAWLWLATVAADQRERVFCLQKLLDINPTNETARKALNALLKVPDPPVPPVAGLEGIGLGAPGVPADAFTIPVEVPLPSADQIAAAQRQAEVVVQAHLDARAAISGASWSGLSSTRHRSRFAAPRVAVVAAAALILVVVAGLALVALNNRQPPAVAAAPTATATSTTMPATETIAPGATYTPSPTPRQTTTPTPTVPPGIVAFDPAVPLRPTDAYPRPDSVPLRSAAALLARGDGAAALPTLVAEREAVAAMFNPVPYFYEALAHSQGGDHAAALALLADAEVRIAPGSSPNVRAVIDAAFAVVYSRRARDGRPGSQAARDDAEQAETHARAALAADPRLVDAYLALADVAAWRGARDEAVARLDEGLAVASQAGDARLLLHKGALLLEQGRYDEATQQAFLVLYQNPYVEDAHRLRVQAALASGDPGLGVLLANEYIRAQPGSPWAYVLLGDARRLEGNPNEALAAYARALTVEADADALVTALLGRSAIYEAEGRYDLALADLSRALDMSGAPGIRLRRMDAARRAGVVGVALADAEALRGAGLRSDDELDLVTAQLLVDSPGGDSALLRDALALLTPLRDLTREQAALRDEYAARAYYGLGNYGASLDSITRSLAAGETPERHFLRGLALEARDDLEGAAREYAWVVLWGRVTPLAVAREAEARLDTLGSDIIFGA